MNMRTLIPGPLEKVLALEPRFLSMVKGYRVTDLLPEYKSLCLWLFKNHGYRFGTQILKELYSESLYYSLEVNFEPQTSIWLKRDKEKFPYVLSQFKKRLRGRSYERRMTLTILRSYESIELSPVEDLSSVVDPSSGDQYYSKIRDRFLKFLINSDFINKIRKDLLYELQEIREEKPKHPHYSFKKGIEGYSVLTCGKQSLAINRKIGESLLSIAKNLKLGYFPKLLGWSRKFYKDHEDIQTTTSISTTYTGRITFVKAPGGKTRLVAIGNYYIQDVFKYIHRALYGVLRKIPQDGTYDQDQQSQIVKKLTKEKVDIWSYDLTKATDRFPVSIQKDVLKSLNKEIGDNWEIILDNLKFYFKGNSYQYKVGQPMGLYSSWAVFAITHHSIIQYCAYISGRIPFSKYAVLGDDVAIWDRKVAEKYKELIEGLDIKISDLKSFYPNKSSNSKLCIAEFAKRIFVNGKEITPIPPDIIRESMESHYEIPELIRFLSEREVLREPIPVSRFCYSDKRNTEICCMLKLRQVLGTNLMVNLDKCPTWIDKITKELILASRIESMSEQASLLYDQLEIIDSKLESELEKLVDLDSYADCPIYKIFEGLYFKVREMEVRLTYFMSFEYLFEEKDKDVLADIQELEYLPLLNFEEILNARNSRPRRLRTYKGRYILKLAKRITEKSRQDALDILHGALI
jgi:hypothetical protein